MVRGLKGSGGFIVKDFPKEYQKKYYAKNKKYILAKAKERYRCNPEKYKRRTRLNYYFTKLTDSVDSVNSTSESGTSLTHLTSPQPQEIDEHLEC